MIHIYFVGSHSTGKTQLARRVSQRYELPLVSEVARVVLAEAEVPLVGVRADLDRVGKFQRDVFWRQLRAEEQYESFVSDRSFDNLAYAALHTTELAHIIDEDRSAFDAYLKKVQASLVFFCRPEEALLCEDGVRAEVSMVSAQRVDAAVQFMLELWRVPYVSVRGTDRQERWRLVSQVVNLYLGGRHAL